MKKHLLMLLVAILATVMSLNAQTIIIDEGFENGIQDSVWTQEYVTGHTAWAVEDVEDGLSWPGTVKQGTKRAYLRNTTGETQGYKTRLVSKAMDLSPRKVYQPQLIFWYANPKWAADRDTLRVLYRTGLNAKWKQLAEYSNAMANWQKVTLELPEVGPVYQIAFEGSDNLGRGIVLDSIKLRSAPECTVPHDIFVSNKGSNRVNIAWAASWDAVQFELIVSKDTINPYEITEELDSTLTFHGLVNGLQQNYDLTLESGEEYYVYIRSICENEISLWSSEETEGLPYHFRVRATKQVPFTERFAYPKTQSQDPEWTWHNSVGATALTPWVNSKVTSKSELAKYSNDTTSAVIFSGLNSSGKIVVGAPITAGKYAFVATPALADTLNPDFAINRCQVHFWSTVYTYVGRQYGRGLIVGVMDDPDDITTFVPVDTVTVWGNKAFQENIVELSSYTGNGAYIGFVSDFDRQNLFYIDNVSIEYIPQVQKVTRISVNPRDTFATIEWEGNAASYNVLITNAEVNPANPDPAAIVDQATVTTNSYRTDSLEAYHGWNNHPYYAYVQAVGADWSYRYPFVTLDTMSTEPYVVDFEQKIKRVNLFGNDAKYPSLTTTNKFKGSQCLYMDKVAGTDAWITLPMVEDLDSVQVKFYLSGGASANTYKKAHATLGVMTNPMDINTFHKVASFTLTADGYTMCYANFKTYTGPKDGVIAIVWDDVRAMAENTINYIDELRVEHVSECAPPQSIALDAMSDSVTVTWAASSQNYWEVAIVKNSALTVAEKDKTFEEIARLGKVVFADTLVWMGDEHDDPEFGIGGLKDQTDYVMYIRTVCNGDAAWWTELPFSTPCPNASFPYKETFESYSTGVATSQMGCWQMVDYLGSGYPLIYSANGGKTLELWTTGTTHRNVAIMPPIEGDLSTMMLCFETRSWSSGTTSTSVLYVGTMDNIDDQSTFVPFDTIRNTGGTEFQKVKLLLSNYNLAYDKIAFSSGMSGASDVLIDNIELRDATCLEAYNFRQTNEDEHSVDFAWDGLTTNDQWELRILNKNVALDKVAAGNYDTATVAIINDTVFTGRTFHVEDLQPISTYYVYIRALCGDSVWTVDPIQTACEKMDPTQPNKETFESYAGGSSYSENYQAQCWTTGNRNANASTSYLPYIYNSSSYSNSGSKSYHMYGYSTTSSPAYVVSPEIDIDHMKELAVTFYMYASSSYSWVCGVMSDPTDLSTFVVLDSVKGTGNSEAYTYDLSEYEALIPATAKYFAWRTPYLTSSSYSSLYLDDVSIMKMNCPFTKPSYSDLTAQTVRISSGLRVDNDWLLLISNHELNTDSLLSSTYRVPADYVVYYDTIDTRSKRVSGLSEQTKYYVYTASSCDSVISQWSSITFTTPCLALKPASMGTITFSTEEGYVTGTSNRNLPCWTYGSKTPGLSATSSYIPSVGTTSTYMHNGHNYLYIYDYVYGTTSNYVGAYAIMPELFVDSINKYQVNFWGRGNTSTSYNSQIIVGIISDPSDLNTFVPVDTINLSHTGYEPYSVGFENYAGDYMGEMGTNIIFLSEFGVTNYAYISEISVTLIPSCRPVSSFTVDSVGENSAVVSWKGYQSTYRLLVADKALTDDEKADYSYLVDSIVDHADRVRLTNLLPATSYYVYAQGICDDGDSTDISLLYASVRTTCPVSGGVPLPFFEDFMSYEVDDVDPGCWIFRGSSWTKVKAPTTSEGKTIHAIDLYTTSSGNNGYIVVPAVQANLSDLQASFEARTYGGGATSSATLYMGTMADPEDPTTFVQAASFALSGSEFQRFEVNLGDYNLAYDRLVFTSGLQSGGTSNDLYITNIGLNLISGCHIPKLKTVTTSASAAEVEITSDADLWDIVVISESELTKIRDLNKYLDTTSAKLRVDTNFVTISNLASATTYNVYARSICGGALGNSAWTKNPLKVHTNFFFKQDYFFGFEKTELWERSTNSTSDNYYIHPALVADRDTLGATSSSYNYYPYSLENTTAYLYSHTGTGALSMTSSANYFGAYVIFPAIDQAQARSFELKVRPAYISALTMQPAVSADAILEIGTVDRNRSFDTYEPLVAIRLDKLDTKEAAEEDNHYLYSYYTLDLDSATMADKQMVIHAPKQPSLTTYLYIDDVTLGEAKGYSLVNLEKVTPLNGTTALVEWQNIGGPWNLDILDVNGDPVMQYTNLTTTSQLVNNLSPRSDYTVVLTAANAPSKTDYVVTSKLSFRTVCQALEPDENGAFTWDFDSENEWEANDILSGSGDSLYLKPACFNVGITYETPVNGYQWLVQRKGYDYYSSAISGNSYANYEVGRDNSSALRVHTTSNYLTSYLVLPALNCNLDTMMVEFYGRCFVNYDDEYETTSNQGKIVGANYLGAAYSHSMVVGTLTDPNDFSTLQVLDTLTYRQTNLSSYDNVNNDPAGLKYWEKMQAPLAGAQGQYIVLFQPAPGLFFLDDLSVKSAANTLFAPVGALTSDITSASAVLSWEVRHPELSSVVVLLNAAGEELLRDTINATSYTLSDLVPGTAYQWYVYQTDLTNNSPETTVLEFHTDCVVIAPDYTCGFEAQEGSAFIEGQTTALQTMCWTYGDAIQGEWKNATYDPQNQSNTENYAYSRTDSTAVAMRASYSSYGTSYQPYIAMPAMDITSYDTLQVSFWIRPAYIRRSNNRVAVSYTGSSYSKSIIVGTMTDPTDAATFVAIDTVTYEGTLSTADEATAGNHYLYQQMKVELAGATGPYVAFMTSFYAKGADTRQNSDYIWIDDISFEHRQDCKAPTELIVTRLGAVDATLSWQGGDSIYVLQVSEDQYFADEDAFAFNDTIDAVPYTVTGLEQKTTYYWRVQAICSGNQGESDFAKKESFKTLISPYYYEPFNAAVSTSEWIFSSSHADDILDHNVATSTTDNSYGFKRITNDYGLTGSHYTSAGYYLDYNWMITPAFYLPENDSVHFSMDLALTALNTTHMATGAAVSESDMANDYYFMVVVSEDGGATWKSENIIAKWQNTNAVGQQLRDIPATGMNVRLSLAAYAGKNVRIGLYREAKTSLNTGIAVHVDNVRLAYFDKEIEHASGCQYEDIVIGDIVLPGETTQPGIHIYPKSNYASDEEAKAGARDLVYSLEVEVYPATEVFYSDTICEGDTYTDANFHDKTQEGVYRRKMESVHGCDSIVTLNLFVTPRTYAEEQLVSICPGETYMWNDKPYNRAGLYTDTLVSSLGCDSIETLIVSYVEGSEDTIFVEERVELNELPYTYEDPQHPYVVGQAPIYYAAGTEKGVYVDTVAVQGTQCSTVLIHTLTIYDAHEDIDIVNADGKGARKVIINDNLYIIINDEWYNAAGQKVANPRTQSLW